MRASRIQLPTLPDLAQAVPPLLRVCGVIAGAPSLDAALRTACAAAVEVLGYGHAAAVLLAPGGVDAVVRAEQPARGTAGKRIPLHELAVLQGMMRSRAPLRVNDVRSDGALQPLRALLDAAGIRALLALPIVRGERLLGWLSVHDTSAPRAFGDEEVAHCQTLAQQLAPLVENEHLRDVAHAHAGELQTLRQASTAIGALLQQGDREIMLSVIVKHAAAALQAKSAGIYRYIPEQDHLILTADYLRPQHRGKVLRPGEGLAGRLVQTGREFAMQRNYSEWDGRAAVFEGEESIGAVLAVLVRWQDVTMGVLYIDDEAGRVFSPDEVAWLELLADQAAMVLANADQRERQGPHPLHLALHRVLSQPDAATLEDRLTLIAREAATVIDAESCQVLLAHTPDFLTLEAGYGHREGWFDRGRRFRIQTGSGTGLTGHIAHERRVFRQHGDALTNHPATRGLPNEHMPSARCCSLLAIPLLRHGADELLGLLRIENRRGTEGRPDPEVGFSEEDERTALLFATAMQNEVLLVALEERARMDRRRERLMTRVFDSRRNLHAEMDTRQLRHELTQVAVDLLGYEAACLYDVDETPEQMVVTAATGLPPGVRGDRESLVAGVAGLVALTGAAQVWVAPERGEPYRVGGREFDLAIGAPLRRARGEVASVLVVAGTRQLRRFVEIDRDVLSLFADQVSSILQSSILWNWERRSFVRSSALGRIEAFILRSRDRRKALPALLTGITAGYGLGFNRAAVFLLDAGHRTLRGEAAIGHCTEPEARTDWLALEADGMENVRTYLEHLEAHGHIETPLDARVRKVRVRCPQEFVLLLQATQEDGGDIIREPEGLASFPRAVLEAYQPVLPLVLAPLVVSGDVVGFVMADTPFGREKPTSYDDLKGVVRLAATASAALDETPQPWALFNSEQLGALERLDDQARPHPDEDWNALADVQEQIVAAALGIFHADSAVLWAYEARSESFRLVACAGVQRGVDDLLRRHPPQQGGTSYQVLESGWVPVEEVDTERYPFLSASTLEVLNAVGARSFQGVALTVGDEQVGVLFIDYALPRTFDADDAHMALRFAERAALTLRRAQMLDVLHQVGRVRRTAQVLARVSTAEPLQQVLKTVVEGTQKALKSNAVTLYRYDSRAGKLLDPPTADGVEDVASLDAEDEKVVDHFVHRVLRGGTMRVVEDVLADPDFRETRFTQEERIRSCVAVSLRVREPGEDGEDGQPGGEQQVGVMFVNFRDPHQFTAEECENIRLFADQAAVAIHNAQLHEELRAALRKSQAYNAVARFGLVDREWVHNASHLSSSMRGWVDHLRKKLQRGRELGHVSPELSDALRSSADRFLSLALPRISAPPVAGPADADMELVFADDLVARAVRTWSQRKVLTRNVRLSAAPGASDAAVLVNRKWMLRALGILIDNALREVAESPLREVVVGTRRAGDRVEFVCTDTGNGFRPDVLDRLRRMERVTTRKEGTGSGTGLINAQNIALTYDGVVKLSNRTDGQPGAVVRISLPVSKPVPAGAPVHKEAP